VTEHRQRDWSARSGHAANREHERALYAFGGGGSGALKRLGGWVKSEGGTIWAATGNAVGETVASRAIVLPHEVIATQQGIATDVQGVDCSLCDAGTS